MKNFLLILCAVLLFAACSAPKYSYNFDHYDYNTGRKQAAAKQDEPRLQSEEARSPLIVAEESIVASIAPVVAETKKASLSNTDKKTIASKIVSMSKAERKELKKDLKAEIKKFKAKKGDNGASVNATKAMDHDLKLAAIFGAVGLILTLLGGAGHVFWVLGVIALVIGAVFFIKWLSRQ
jgi:5'-3' exonuclease